MRESLYKIWMAPRWAHFAIALILVTIVMIMRWYAQPVLGERAQFVFLTIPVAIAAFVGGLWPGLAALSASMAVGIPLLLLPNQSLDTLAKVVQVGAFSFTWLFICIACDLMRTAALDYRKVAFEREQTRRSLDQILDGISDAFFAAKADGTIVHANSSFSEFINTPEASVIGADMWAILGGDEWAHTRQQLHEVIATGQPRKLDASIGSKWFHISAFPIETELFVYVQDVTERKEIEGEKERLLRVERQAREVAEEATQQRDEFVAMVSHELRTPLTSILGWADILQRRAATHPEFVEGLQIIERSTRSQAQLIDDLLDLSRISAGKLRLNLELVDLAEIIREVVHAYSPAAFNKGVKLVVEQDLPELYTRGDSTRISQIVSNLISNAIKFTPRGGSVVSSTRLENQTAVIEVRDNGEGIEPAHLNLIFDRFRQSYAGTDRKHGGLGLGLAIVKQLAEMHGGSATARSDGPGLGSTLTVYLPITPVPAQSLPEPAPKVESQSEVIKGIRVLLVEDDAETRRVLLVGLQDAGAIVQATRSAMEALDCIDEFEPDILISDIGMPEIDGYQLIRMVREKLSAQELPAIALSAFTREQDQEQALKSGYNGHLSKPIQLHDLFVAIAQETKARMK